jgi:hypothetical protein
MKKFDFDFDLMGKKVLVNSVYIREFNQETSYFYWDTCSENRVGFVVGYRWLNEGKYVPGSGGGYDYDPPQFKTKRRFPAILISFWPNENPKFVPVDGFKIADGCDFLYFYPSAGYGVGRSRERMLAWARENCENWPRDKKGRWIRDKIKDIQFLPIVTPTSGMLDAASLIDDFTPIDILYEFEGPAIFTIMTKSQQQMLTYLIEENDRGRWFILAPCGIETVSQLKANILPVRDALCASWMWLVNVSHTNIISIWEIQASDIPDICFPTPGTTLYRK